MLDLMRTRRSVRHFSDAAVEDGIIDAILEAGTWAPSGMNNQPWRFAVIKDPQIKARLAPLTTYSRIITAAPVLIAVFLDEESSYDRTKDCQSIGACIENMLLAIHGLGLGGVWLGEILKSRDAVAQMLGAPQSCELMAVLAFGHPAQVPPPTPRRPFSELVFFRR